MKKTLLTLALLAAAVGQTQAATYAVDPNHTFVTYEMLHFGTSTNRGRFAEKDGVVEFDKAAKTGKVSISFPIKDVNTGVVLMDKHLQSAEFFDVEKFPTASFVGDKFSFNGDKVTEISGMLTLKGQAHPVTLKADNFNCYQNPMLKREVCGGDFEAVIDRTQWGMDYGLAYGFSKNVKLIIQVEAVQQ
jgi:polyisoprenoid-binding protein YceI